MGRSCGGMATQPTFEWKGPAYDAFKAHIQAISKQLADMNSSARLDDGIVGALNNAADKLEQAQADMPIPAVCVREMRAEDLREP